MNESEATGGRQSGVEAVDVPMAIEKVWHLIQSELPVASWAKGASAHEFSLIDETGHFAFSLVPSGNHACVVIYRSDLDYSEGLIQDTTDLLTSESKEVNIEP